jgi:cupin superfamily acireductone dioxygenase involved in methionine salvage
MIEDYMVNVRLGEVHKEAMKTTNEVAYCKELVAKLNKEYNCNSKYVRGVTDGDYYFVVISISGHDIGVITDVLGDCIDIPTYAGWLIGESPIIGGVSTE